MAVTFKGVVFDLFHTLVDPERFRPPEFNRARLTAAFFGLDPAIVKEAWVGSHERRLTDRSSTLVDLVKELLAARGRPAPPAADLESYDREVGRYQDEAILDPDQATLRTLSLLRSAGLRLGVLSNADERDRRAWDRSPLAPLFDVAHFSCDTGRLKPDPRAYRLVLDALGLSAPECAFVGDGGAGELSGARDAGFGLVVFMRGHVRKGLRTAQECRKLRKEAHAVVDSLEGLIPLVLGDDPAAAEKTLVALGTDPSWETRETAAALAGDILTRDFDGFYPTVLGWTAHPSAEVRRMAALAVMYASKKRKEAWVAPILNVLERLLPDRAVYVRKNLGPFAVGSALLLRHPAATLEWLRRHARSEDEQVLWNVATAFSAAPAKRHVEEALEILGPLAAHPSRYVWRAAASSSRFLGRAAPDKVVPVLRRWAADPARRQAAEIALRYADEQPGTGSRSDSGTPRR